jgi:hypothetical protein
MYTSKNIQRFPIVTHEELENESHQVRNNNKVGGIYRVVAHNGEIAHYSTSWDLQRAKKHNLRQLVLGEHVHHWLQEVYNSSDLRSIRFEIVEIVRRPKRRLVLPTISSPNQSPDWRKGRGRRRGVRKWNHRGGDQVSGNPGAWVGGLPPPESLPVQAFTYDDYEKILAKKLKKHHIFYLQNRLGVLLQGYRNKQIVPRLRVWQAALWAARKKERNAAAKQIQRVYRGRRTRQALWRWKVKQSSIAIQCCIRVHQAWSKVSTLRWKIVSYIAARIIQRAYKTHVAQSFARVHIVHVRRSRSAKNIQRVWRGKVGRDRFFHALLVRSAIKIQCRWRIRQGGLALHLKRQHAKQLEESEQQSALSIQCMTRQYFSRMIRDDLEYNRLVRAAIKIQCRWRIRQGGLALHLKKQARKHQEQHLQELERAAIRVQAAWRRKKGQFALHLKRQAQKRMTSQKDRQINAVNKIQHWWAVVTGTYSSKLALRAKRQHKIEAKLERETMEFAALRVQSMWRRRQGGLALHLKRQGRALEAKEHLAASRIQMWWHSSQGNFAAQLKARAKVQQRKEEVARKEELDEMNLAALRVQSMWRRRQGGLALHMKRQAQKFALEQEKIDNENAHRIQVWWSHMSGNFAAKMKARAKMQLVKEEQQNTKAAHRIQVWWSHMSGNFAAKMKARARMQLIKEEKEEDEAAHRIQLWWHLKSGNFAAKLKARAKMQSIKEDRMAHKIQLWWYNVNGNFAQRIKERARAEIAEEWRQLESAALRVQSRWRTKKGQFSYHLKQKALKRLAGTVDDWLRYRDEWTMQDYYYSETLDRTVYFKPESYVDPGKWYAMIDEESRATYYAKFKEDDIPLWEDVGLSLETEDLEVACETRGLIGEGLSRNEYIAQLRAWLENPNSHEFSWDFPPGAELIDTPKVPPPPRTYLTINGYWRRQKRKGLNSTKVYWNKKPNLKRFIYSDLHPKHAEVMNKAAFNRRKIQMNMKEQIQLQLKKDEAERIRIEEEESRKHVSPLKSKTDLHNYVVRTFARRQRRLQPLKTKHQSQIEKGDRIKVKSFVGGFVSLKTVLRYYPGVVLRVRKSEHIGDETYDILLDDGVKRTGSRRDQILLEFQDEPDPIKEEEEKLKALIAQQKEEEPEIGFAVIVNTKKMVGNMLAKIGKLPADDPRNNIASRGSSNVSSNQDGVHAALKTRLDKKRQDLLSRGSLPSRASSRMRTPGPT